MPCGLGREPAQSIVQTVKNLACTLLADHRVALQQLYQQPAVVGVCAPVCDSVMVPQVSLDCPFAGAALSVYTVAVGATENVMVYLILVPVAPLGETADSKAAFA